MKEYLKQITELPGSVKFYIMTEIIMGLGMGIWSLNLNFFLLSKGMTSDKIGLIVSVGSFSTALFAIIAGSLSDCFGYRKCMLAGFLLKALAMTGTVIVSPGMLLYLLRGLNGLGDCFIMVCAYPYITSMADQKNRDMVYGLLFSTTMMSLFLGNTASGFLAGSIRSYGTLIFISASIVCLVALLRFFLPAGGRKKSAFKIKIFIPRHGFIGVYLIYELIGYGGYFMAYSMINLICKSRMGLDDGTTGFVSGTMTLVSGAAIFVIPAVAGKMGRAGTNTILMLGLVVAYPVMALTGGTVFLMLVIVTAAMQCMMGGLIDGPMLGKVSEVEKGGFSGLKLFLQYTGTSAGTFLAGVMIKDVPDLTILYLTVCFIVIIQLSLFVFGIKKHIAKE